MQPFTVASSKSDSKSKKSLRNFMKFIYPPLRNRDALLYCLRGIQEVNDEYKIRVNHEGL